ncbi:hypothetical protein [Pseudomonas aeruginosa]|uniref:hypothetical protein n=1 Tax=Pseudomonas aeruginosa TaxID=287 RepID=UPI000FC3F767|nr:hypothetical protein [Pseudomonas aeruginosa]RUB40146.1 hypothetical protein IPC1432_04705 [Pseudomonas aeruginosa]HCD6630744.1 hypothetical protein [Pseudomonas aeruginosa]HDQ4735005.1 hypothetical protein [Pseudomonas aeruginosa]
MSLLDNAIRSIQIGLQDYKREDRLISSIRNLYAGILLLFKYKLLLLSENESNCALIKQNIVPALGPDGRIIWKGIGDKTVDVNGIKTRFKHLEIAVDWKIFDRISRYRNEIEHYFSSLPKDEVDELLADCFRIISSFFSEHLSMDAKKSLGDDAWEVLLYAYEVYEHEVEKSELAIGELVFQHEAIRKIFLNFECIYCSSALIRPAQRGGDAISAIFCCAECNRKYSYDEICNYGAPDLYIESFWSGYDKGDSKFSNCTSCGQGIYLKEFSVCTSCGS